MRAHPAPPRGRSGITLIEILISILILGVGLISLATLFPIGLLRLRAATRYSRSAYLVESAAADLEARNLLSMRSFTNPFISPWYFDSSSVPYNPWQRDTSTSGTVFLPPPNMPVANPGAFQMWGPGLPVAYDPLWRAQTNSNGLASGAGTYQTPGSPFANEARFGSGIGFLRPDPGDGGLPSAHGLQRITNLDTGPTVNIPPSGIAVAASTTVATVADILVSPEDMVLTEPTAAAQTVTGTSPILPQLDPTTGFTRPLIDWRYSWIFTGNQADVSNGTVFDGDIVIFENRQFGFDASPTGAVVAGERVVEAVYACNGTPSTNPPQNHYGGVGLQQTVLLRWPVTQPDPEVKTGDWFADVTYERDQNTDNARSAANAGLIPEFPNQRCYWYQISKKTQPDVDTLGDVPAGTYRSMVVYTTVPLRAWTILDKNGWPVHNQAALICPSVVNVFPRTIYTR